MAKYMIHACPQREWYVEKFLIPSMLAQGIDKQNIILHTDTTGLGCLESCMRGFLLSEDYAPNRGIWHLQDDIIISSDFKEKTEKYDLGVVCGYCFNSEKRKEYIGLVTPDKMWMSFPCIRVPTDIAVDCAKWYHKYAKVNTEYRMIVRAKKYDDSVFLIYMEDHWPNMPVRNLVPNIVDHIDYLIGGSQVNKDRAEIETRAEYFDDKDLVKKLKIQLDKHYDTC